MAIHGMQSNKHFKVLDNIVSRYQLIAKLIYDLLPSNYQYQLFKSFKFDGIAVKSIEAVIKRIASSQNLPWVSCKSLHDHLVQVIYGLKASKVDRKRNLKCDERFKYYFQDALEKFPNFPKLQLAALYAASLSNMHFDKGDSVDSIILQRLVYLAFQYVDDKTVLEKVDDKFLKALLNVNDTATYDLEYGFDKEDFIDCSVAINRDCVLGEGSLKKNVQRYRYKQKGIEPEDKALLEEFKQEEQKAKEAEAQAKAEQEAQEAQIQAQASISEELEDKKSQKLTPNQVSFDDLKSAYSKNNEKGETNDAISKIAKDIMASAVHASDHVNVTEKQAIARAKQQAQIQAQDVFASLDNLKEVYNSKVRVIDIPRPLTKLDLQDPPLLETNYQKFTGLLEVLNKDEKTVFYNFYPLIEWYSNGECKVIRRAEACDLFSLSGKITLQWVTNSTAVKKLQALGNNSILNITFDREWLEPNPYEPADRGVQLHAEVLFGDNLVQRADKDVLAQRACYIVRANADEESKFDSMIHVSFFGNVDSKTNFNGTLAVVKTNYGLIGPFVLHKDMLGNYYVNPTNVENNSVYSPDKHLIQRLENLTKETHSETHNFSNPIMLLGPKHVNYHTMDVIDDETLLKGITPSLDLDEDVIHSKTTQTFSYLMPNFEEFARGRTVRIMQLCANLKFGKDTQDQFLKLFEYVASQNIDFLKNLTPLILQNKQIVDTLIDNSSLGDKKQKIEKDIANKENSINEAKENLANLQKQSKDLESQIKEKKDLLKAFKDIEAARAERDTLKEDSERYREQIKNDKKQFEEFDGGLAKYERRLQTTANLVAQLSFDDAITSKIMEAANSGAAKNESDIRQKRFEVIKGVKTIDYKGEQLVRHLCNHLSQLRKYDNSNFEYLNLLTCITQNFLTVISGAPGSGKTSICNILGRVLGLNNIENKIKDKTLWKDPSLANRYMAVSVERGWNSKRDFIGYFNPLTRNFESTDPQRIECFRQLNKEALENFDKLPYLVLLDEANLSPMEYYFADFMNICDARNDTSTISLSGTQRYQIPDSLRFLATINNDHTTDRLSPRLLDRAFIVSLPRSNFSNVEDDTSLFDPINFNNLKDAFKPSLNVRDALKDEFDTIHEGLSDLNIQLSFRSEKAILNYVSAMSGWISRFRDLSEDDRNEYVIALDYAISQKALPQIDLLGEQYSEPLSKLQNNFEQMHLDKCSAILKRMIDKGQDMDDYRFFKG